MTNDYLKELIKDDPSEELLSKLQDPKLIYAIPWIFESFINSFYGFCGKNSDILYSLVVQIHLGSIEKNYSIFIYKQR